MKAEEDYCLRHEIPFPHFNRLAGRPVKPSPLHDLLKERDIVGLSIGYAVRGYEVDEDRPGVWTLTKIDLHEVSVVSISANENATIDAVKAEKAGAARIDGLIAKVAAGDRLTEREFEELAKGTWRLSNSQAERAARVHLKGQGEPAKADQEALAFLRK